MRRKAGREERLILVQVMAHDPPWASHYYFIFRLQFDALERNPMLYTYIGILRVFGCCADGDAELFAVRCDI